MATRVQSSISHLKFGVRVVLLVALLLVLTSCGRAYTVIDPAVTLLDDLGRLVFEAEDARMQLPRYRTLLVARGLARFGRNDECRRPPKDRSRGTEDRDRPLGLSIAHHRRTAASQRLALDGWPD